MTVGWLVTRIAVGCLLLVTATLKAFFPTESILLESAYNLPRWLLAVVVQAEIAVGAALLFNLRPRATHRISQAMFFLFAGFAAYRAISGAESCGCFGPVKVHPWWMVGLDTLVLTLLTRFQPASDGRTPVIVSTIRTGVCYMVLGGVCLAAMMTNDVDSTAENSLLVDVGGLTLLEPEEWVGEAFPLGPYILPQRKIDSGSWIIVLYHHDCPKCREARPRYETLAESTDHASVLLVEAPPYDPEHRDAVRANKNSNLYARLTDEREWFVQAPVEIQTLNGRVTGASLDLPSIQNAAH